MALLIVRIRNTPSSKKNWRRYSRNQRRRNGRNSPSSIMIWMKPCRTQESGSLLGFSIWCLASSCPASLLQYSCWLGLSQDRYVTVLTVLHSNELIRNSYKFIERSCINLMLHERFIKVKHPDNIVVVEWICYNGWHCVRILFFLQHFPIAAFVASYATDAIILFQLLGILIDAILCNSTYFSQLLVCYIRVRLH